MLKTTCLSDRRSKSRCPEYYNSKLEKLIQRRNKSIPLEKMYPKNGSKQPFEYSRKKRPPSADIKKAITLVGPYLEKISSIFKVNKSVVEYWISTDKEIYAFFVNQNSNRSGFVQAASTVASIYDISYAFTRHGDTDEWMFCISQSGLTPFEILTMNRCRFWNAEEELRYRLYSFAYFKKYQDQMVISFAAKKINSAIQELNLFKRSNKEKILSHFEEIYGISYFEMLQKKAPK